MALKALTAARVFDGERLLVDHAVILDGDRIHSTRSLRDLPTDTKLEELGAGVLAPGFIDVQVNGGGGVMFNNQTDVEALARITLGHRSRGTTSLMPTLISDTPEVQQAGMAAVADAMAVGNHSVLGIHIEGPFFALPRRGTHKADMIRELTEADVQWLTAHPELTVMLTLAPECVAPGVIQRLSEAGILVCAGHTEAGYEDIVRARAEGLRGFTHLFNAMSPLQSRQPGTVGAALDSPDTWAGIIADGHHVHPASIRVAQNCLPEGKLLLVSDAMSTVGGPDKSFVIYGEEIREQDGCLINAEGALAGSAIGLIDAVKYCVETVGTPLTEALRMASHYPAYFLNRENELGKLNEGMRADLVHFDDSFCVQATWVAGQMERH